jgi:hypothetical protein
MQKLAQLPLRMLRTCWQNLAIYCRALTERMPLRRSLHDISARFERRLAKSGKR